MIVVAMIGTMIPNADAYWVNGVEYGHVEPVTLEPPVDYTLNVSDPNVSGKIILSENEFKLYRGTIISIPIFIEMNDFIHNPTLNIFYDNVLIKTIYPRSNGDIFQSMIALNDNWKSGIYEIKLNHHDKILDVSSFEIHKDNELFSEKIIFKSMFVPIDPYISATPSKVSIESFSNKIISITGSITGSTTTSTTSTTSTIGSTTSTSASVSVSI